MKAAGIVALVIAALLLGSAFIHFRNDALARSSDINAGFAAIQSGDDAAFENVMAAGQARQSQMQLEGICGAAFLVAGIAMVARRRATAT